MGKALEYAKEIAEIALDNNISVHDLLEQYKKAHSLCDQTKENEHIKTVNDIIPVDTDLDNGEVYNIESGQTIKEI